MSRIFLPIASLLILLLSSCSSEKVTHSESEQLEKLSTTTNKMLSEEYISPLPDDAPIYIVTMTGTNPPFSLRNDHGLLKGIDVDVIRAVGEVEGFKVKFLQSVDWADMFNLASTGKADLAMSGISYREERNNKYALSDAYFFNPVSVAYTDVNLNVKTLQDLQGKKIGGIIKGISIDFAKEVKDAEIIEQKTPFLAYTALIRDEIDATIYDYPVLQFYAQQLPEYPVIIKAIEEKDIINNKGAFAVVMSSKDNGELIQKVNSGLATLKKQGTIDEIRTKWLDPQ